MSNKNSIHILLFSSLFPHAGEPTLGVFVETRLRNLIKDQNVKATVVAPVPWFPLKGKAFGAYGRAASAPLREQRNGIDIYHPRYLVIPKIGMLITPFFLYFAAIKTIKALIKNGTRIDLIDAHYLYPDGVAAAKLSRKLKLPMVMTARGSDVTQIAEMTKPRQMILNAARVASHIITVSQSLKDKLVSKGADGSKITPLRNGVDLVKFTPVEGAKQKVASTIGFDEGKPVIVFAGWLIPRKRVDIVIDVISKHSDAIAIIIGDGPLRSELEEQALKNNVIQRVFFIGQKKPDDMPLYFSAADILMLPSEREGWANVLLEAMACGAPVVSRAVDGACELVTTDQAGRLVDEHENADAYVDAVKSLLSKMPSRVDVRNYAKGFGWEETSRGQYEIFKQILDKATD